MQVFNSLLRCCVALSVTAFVESSIAEVNVEQRILEELKASRGRELTEEERSRVGQIAIAVDGIVEGCESTLVGKSPEACKELLEKWKTEGAGKRIAVEIIEDRRRVGRANPLLDGSPVPKGDAKAFKQELSEAERISVWGEPGTFPQAVVALLMQQDKLTPDSASAQEISSVAEELVEVLDSLKGLVASTEGRRVKARLSVIDVLDGRVLLLPDATYGFPTRPIEEVIEGNKTPGSIYDERDKMHLGYSSIPLHSSIQLQLTGTTDTRKGLELLSESPKCLELMVGKDIPQEVAEKLWWNDKLLVDFRVDAIETFPKSTTVKEELVLSNEELMRTIDGGETLRERYAKLPHCYCRVKISDLRFLKFELPDAVASSRVRLWPGPGTLPFIVNSIEGGNGTGDIINGSLVTDYASLFSVRGSAVFRVWSGEGDRILLNGRPLIGTDKEADLCLGSRGSHGFPIIHIARNALEQIEELRGNGQHVLLYFNAKAITGTGGATGDGQVILLEDLRVGTKEELNEAEKVVAVMKQLRNQYARIMQAEKMRQLAEAARLIAEGQTAEQVRLRLTHESTNETRIKELTDIATQQKQERDALEVQLMNEKSKSQLGKGTALLQQDKYSEAVIVFDEILSANSSYPDAYAGRATAWHQLKQDGKAFEDFSEAIRLNPDKAAYYFGRGACHGTNTERAMEDYDLAIEKNPDFSPAKKAKKLLQETVDR